MEDLTKLLVVLNEIMPITSKKTQSKFELNSEKVANYMLLTAFAFFAILLILVGWQILMFPLPAFWKNAGRLISIFSMIFSSMSLFVLTFAPLPSIFKFKSERLRRLLLEIKHDKEHVEKLIEFKRTLLEETQVWLQLKSDRLENRMGLFVGNSEKITLFSLAGFSWQIYNLFSEKALDTKLVLTTDNLTQNLLIWATAFLTGIAIGAVVMNFQLRRYTYYLELINLALARKQKSL